MARGTYDFEITTQGDLMNSSSNVDALRKMWLGRELVFGYYLGPGNPNDFDNGAWHSACHLVAAGGVMRAASGELLWLEISHDPAKDEYFSSVTLHQGNEGVTHRLDSAHGRNLTSGATLLGYVEGNSVGRISGRGVNDPPDRFLGWRRQDFDQPADSGEDGGKVWEHWCTVRDIRPSCAIATSVLTAYVSLCSALGDRFAATVARGRVEYGHPEQLGGMVAAGFTARESALWDTTPLQIPPAAAALLNQAEPSKSLQAAGEMDWSNPPRYYMFARRIASWNPAASVAGSLRD